MQRLFIIALALATGGCAYGLTAQTFRPATDPRGIETRITTASGVEIAGELIEVRAAGLVLITTDRVVRFVPYTAVHRLRLAQLGAGSHIGNSRPPSAPVRERLRLVSRFPHGMSASVLADLLKAHGQTSLDGVADERAPSADAQGEFIQQARAGTAKYRDRAVAIGDGYRRIGRDFPAMGEHWIRMGLIFDGKLEPERPEVLNYIAVDGTPELIGVGYAVPLLPGEHPPDGPAGRHAWHDHFRTVEDETVLPRHHTHGDGLQQPRLAMMHAWIWSSNPDGIFAADNWNIPYLRLGLSPDQDTPGDVARALSLMTGGRDYFESAVLAAGMAGEAERQIVREAMDRAETAVGRVVQDIANKTLDETDRSRLAAIWAEMWSGIAPALSPAARARLGDLGLR